VFVIRQPRGDAPLGAEDVGGGEWRRRGHAARVATILFGR
jgi:hypothetical protein